LRRHTPRRARTAVVAVVLAALVGSMLALAAAAAPRAHAAQPVPGHTGLVPSRPRTNTPLISAGEIWDFEVVGSRAYVAGTFSSLQNAGGGTTVNQRLLAAFNINTGQVDTGFRPTFSGGGVNAVEASPDGTKLYVAGSFNTVNGSRSARSPRSTPPPAPPSPASPPTPARRPPPWRPRARPSTRAASSPPSTAPPASAWWR
jgi:hypothetical protein